MGRSITLTAAFLFAGLFCVVFNIEKIFKKPDIAVWIIGLLSPLLFYFVTEILNEHYPWLVLPLSFLLNLLMYLTIELLFYAIFNHYRAALTLSTVLIFVLGIVNHFIRVYKNAPFSLYDIRSIGTLINVMEGGMELRSDIIIAAAFSAYAIYLLIIWKPYPVNIIKNKKGAVNRFILFAVCSCFWIFVLSGALLNLFNISSSIYCSPERNGFILHVFASYYDSKIKEPDSYSVEKIESLLNGYQTETMEDRPNIIVIINESFADLRVIGDFETDMEVMPFIDSLKEISQHGFALSSVYGGNTANSEWEFLTGNSMYYLPEGSVPFQNYLETKTESVASVLSESGYLTSACHPNDSSAWSRKKAWSLLGFDKMYFIEDFKKDNLLNQNLTDLACYQQMMTFYDNNKKEGKPQFIFNVTLQNHTGGYAKAEEQLGYVIHIKDDLAGNYGYAEGYLTLIHESDHAFKWLIEDLSGRNENFVVLFFGDHQVGVTDGFLTDLYNKPLNQLSPEEKTYQYRIPYLIWANYELDYQQPSLTSINYLSSILLNAIGFSGSAYQQYQYDLQKSIPAIHAFGYYDEAGAYHSKENLLANDLSTNDNLSNYWCLEYGYMFK